MPRIDHRSSSTVYGFAVRFLPEPVLRWAKKRHYTRSLRAESFEDEPDLRIVRHLVRPNDHVVDIGANYGLYTKYFSELVGKAGKVYCFEPVPSTYEILSYVIRRLRLANVEPFCLALSNRNATGEMEVPHWATGGENYYQASIVQQQRNIESVGRKVAIQMTTLDAIVPETEAISFVKCDVEGHEFECVDGARKLLEKREAAWLVEVSSDPLDDTSTAHRLFDLFARNDYTAWYLDGPKLRPFASASRSVNFFFLQDSHVEAVRAAGLLA